jgi:plastocyanin
VPHTLTFFPLGQTPPPDFNEFGPPSGATAYGGTTILNSGPLPPGQSFTVTFGARGTSTYHCLIHDDKGMAGTVAL